jgi:hypothetical protein
MIDFLSGCVGVAEPCVLAAERCAHSEDGTSDGFVTSRIELFLAHRYAESGMHP